jgi:tRNA1Val (adenine37-N6)-methyltransferase
MAKDYFQFKQFTVWQDRCAMKVGTDGTLLGALLGASCSSLNKRILDAGTGTGLVALMLAQRFPTAQIDAIDIDEEACIQAADNICRSPFKDRIRVVQQSFLDFSSEQKYDLIASNPPYFERSLKSPDAVRNLARHSDSLPLRRLVSHARTMLDANGLIALILPVQLSDELNFTVSTNGLFLVRRTEIVSIEGTSPKRFIVELSPKPHPPQHETLVLETADHRRTHQYSALMEDFYI